mgnify:CR=1 FL=1
MSGLLVKSTVVMRENLEEMAREGIDIPVLLGGAALMTSFTDLLTVKEANDHVADAGATLCPNRHAKQSDEQKYT